MTTTFEDANKIEYTKEGVTYTITKTSPPNLCISADLPNGFCLLTVGTWEEAKQIFDNA